LKRLTPFRLGPVARLSVGLAAIVVAMVMALDLAFEIIPNRTVATRELRQRFAESLAVQVSVLAEAGDERTLGRTLQELVKRNPDMLSVALRQVSGLILSQRGDHARHWVAPQTGRSTIDQVRVPIYGDGGQWSGLEIAFSSPAPHHLKDWVTEPMFLLIAAFALGGFSLFYPYLRRALSILDPSAAIPDRVRKAFDTLTDGVVVVAPDGRIVLANNAFRRLRPDGPDDLHGHRLSDLPWLRSSDTAGEKGLLPWEQVMRTGTPVEGHPFSVVGPDGARFEMLVGSSPITDVKEQLRGCMVTFDDVTEVHRANEQLRRALEELERSQAKVQAQNEELRVLATRDPLTGCLNRRAFFDLAAELFDEALRSGQEISCIMTDIDHFKSFNDLYGHSVGDQVIQVVVRTMSRHTRSEDLLCRYGGEEFCVLLPGADLEQARSIAERMRAAIEDHAREAVRSTRVEKITSSFGVSSISQGALRLEELIDHADNALYRSKEEGRNRVSVRNFLDE
jgi:diguanylate cyclase (GGDEF)-like protein/PAS domain S-box-containing protein